MPIDFRRELNVAGFSFRNSPAPPGPEILQRVHERLLPGGPDLLARVEGPGYGARNERVVVFRVVAFDRNCPQHITPRYTDEELPGFDSGEV